MVKPSDIVNLYINVDDGTLYADVGLSDLLPVGFVISSGIVIDGALVHGSLAELDIDDHPQYILVDGTRDFAANIATVAGAPTDADHLTRKDYVDTEITNAVASGTAGVAFLNTLQGIITISGAGEVSVFEVGQAIVIEGSPHHVSNALIGSDGITVISGSSIDTVQGFRAEFVAASGTLQTQIDSKADSSELITVSGHLQSEIDTIDTSQGDPALVGAGTVTVISGTSIITISGAAADVDTVEPAIVGVDGNVVISGTSTTTVSGFRDEFVSASGSLQSQISSGGVTSLNSLTGVVDVVGKGEVVVTLEGQDIVVSGTPHTVGGGGGGDVSNALVGSDGITIISGTSTDTVEGFRSEFTSASGSLQSQLDSTVSGINDVFAVRVDEAVAGTTYIGEADPGSAEAANAWRIKRMIETGPDLDLTWVSGTAVFEYAWTDRLILTYS